MRCLRTKHEHQVVGRDSSPGRRRNLLLAVPHAVGGKRLNLQLLHRTLADDVAKPHLHLDLHLRQNKGRGSQGALPARAVRREVSCGGSAPSFLCCFSDADLLSQQIA